MKVVVKMTSESLYLTHWGRVMHDTSVDLPSLLQIMACCLTGTKLLSEPMLEFVNCTLGNKLQWNLNKEFFIQENAFENVVWNMAAILSRPQCVKKYCHHIVYTYIYIWITGFIVKVHKCGIWGKITGYNAICKCLLKITLCLHDIFAL